LKTRGWGLSIGLYVVAFVALVVSAYLQFEGNTKSSLPLVWSGIGVAGVALACAVTSVLVPSR
jgi:hypothetical protein